MSKRIGVIAGSGDFPHFICRRAAELEWEAVVAAVEGQAAGTLQDTCLHLESFEIRRVTEMVAFFKRHDVRELIFAGKIDPRLAFEQGKPGGAISRLLGLSPDRSPTALIRTAIRYLAGQGLTVIDPTPLVSQAFCRPGRLTSSRPGVRVNRDIDFAWDRAKTLADLDIGQCLVVKQGAVVAVEGLEGSDAAIKRAGRLAGPGTVAVKVRRTNQDPRVDLPAVGLETVRSLIEAGAAALCFEADGIPFFQREEAVALAEEHRIALLARK